MKCDQCNEPCRTLIGPERSPLARFCEAHGRAWTRANTVRRGRIIATIRARSKAKGWRCPARGCKLAARHTGACWNGVGMDPRSSGRSA